MSMCYLDMKTGEVDEFKIHLKYTNYGANRFGHVMNFKTKKLIGKVNSNGYITLSFGYEKGKRVIMYGHNFVYECFHGLYDKKNKNDETMVIKHLDNSKTNNNIDNLMLDTQSNNMKDAIKDGLCSKNPRIPKQCTGIDFNNEEHKFKSFRDAERQTGCNNTGIRDCCIGKQKTTTSKTDGSIWKFRYS